MSAIVRYLTHPQVHIDPNVPVPQWGLNELGRSRAEAFAGWAGLGHTTQIVCSAERKAIDTAELISKAVGVRMEVCERMHENDRSATGFLEPEEFEAVVNEFFARPDHSVRGWEKARDAQNRIVEEMRVVIGRDTAGDVLLVGHGGVGTLLYCHVAVLPVDRKHDQPHGGGNVFAFDRESQALIHAWQSIESLCGREKGLR